MTQEDKNLLLKDLCARLPYGVIVKENDGVTENDNKLLDIDMSDGCINYDYIIEDIKPYLRSMSSMTEEETDRMWEIYESGPAAESSVAVTEYLYERHLDCHHLIEKGLALEASDGMYK